MEILGLLSVPGWVFYPLLVVFLLYIYTTFKQGYFRRINIPTKATTPMLGDLLIMGKKGLHYVDAQMVQKYGKCFGLFVGNVPTLIIADPEMIKQITVKQFSNFSDRFNNIPLDKRWSKTVSNATGDHWKFLRSKLSPTFTSGKMRNMVSLIQQSLDSLMSDLEEKATAGVEFDVTPLLRGYTMSVICSTGFGLDINANSESGKLLAEKTRVFFSFNPSANIPFLINIFFPDLFFLLKNFNMPLIAEETMEFFDNMFKDLIKHRTDTNQNYRDLLQLMINAHEGESSDKENVQMKVMTDEEVMMNSLQFMIAGFDTTANTLVWTCYCLANNQDVQDRLIAEIDSEIGKASPNYDNVGKLKYMDMVVNETLRLYPVTPRINRKPLESTEICGHYLPAGLDCTIAISAVQMSPEYWPEPEKFKPERFSPENEENFEPYAYLPFGLGPRNCIGKRLALMEVKMALVTIFQRYRLSPGASLKIPAEISPRGLTKPKDPIMLILRERKTTS